MKEARQDLPNFTSKKCGARRTVNRWRTERQSG
jgi:hypothetical protein